MKKINNLLESNIEKIIVLFLFIQPFLDITTGITKNILNIDFTISSIIRLLFLILCIYYIVILDKTKNNKNKLFITITYIILFSITTILSKDINAYSFEIKNTINTFYLPIVALALIDMFKQYKIKINIEKLLIIYLIYIAGILIPNITNTGFQSYSHSKLGNIGWFLSANAIGNILSILLPIIILYIIENKNKIVKIITIICSIYVFFSIGTKVPIFSAIICCITTLLFYIIKWFKNREIKKITITSVSTLILIISSIIIVPKTSFYKNIEIHKKYLGINNFTEVLTNYEILDHFVFSQRLTFLKNTNNNYKKAQLQEKVFGIGYIENYGTDKASTKTIEIDYLDILYRNGIVGFIIFFSILIPLIIKAKKQLNKKTIQNIEFKTCILLILVIAFFAGHMLITPNVSIFVALVLAIILQGGIYEEINKR